MDDLLQFHFGWVVDDLVQITQIDAITEEGTVQPVLHEPDERREAIPARGVFGITGVVQHLVEDVVVISANAGGVWEG